MFCACRDGLDRKGSRSASRDTAMRLPDSRMGVVEVLNGTGRKGAGSDVAERLRRAGFDVVKVGNAPEKTFSRTVVVQRRGSDSVAARTASLLGAHGFCQLRNENLLVDATVFVGRDIEEIASP